MSPIEFSKRVFRTLNQPFVKPFVKITLPSEHITMPHIHIGFPMELIGTAVTLIELKGEGLIIDS